MISVKYEDNSSLFHIIPWQPALKSSVVMYPLPGDFRPVKFDMTFLRITFLSLVPPKISFRLKSV